MPKKVKILQEADDIFIEELYKNDFMKSFSGFCGVTSCEICWSNGRRKNV